jgi:hypothetical protein
MISPTLVSAADIKMIILRYSDTQILRSSDTQILKYSGPHVYLRMLYEN